MELIQYLNDNFLTKNELTKLSGISGSQLIEYQTQGLMPLASYKLKLDINCDSFFGPHDESHKVEYYAKGYTSWMGIIRSLQTKELIYAEFTRRYIETIDGLKKNGHETVDPKLNDNIHNHIEEEWGHFLNGIYGLCTKTGLPENIAAKELAICEIKELSDNNQLGDVELEKLTRAVDLLDNASSLFAPHERLKSSRHRLIDEVRRKYRLSNK